MSTRTTDRSNLRWRSRAQVNHDRRKARAERTGRPDPLPNRHSEKHLHAPNVRRTIAHAMEPAEKRQRAYEMTGLVHPVVGGTP